MTASLFQPLLTLTPLASAVLAPGALWVMIEARISQRCSPQRVERAVKFCAYSLIFYAVWFSLFPTTAARLDQGALQLTESMEVARSVVLLLPLVMLLGGLTGLAIRHDFLGLSLRRLGLSVSARVDTGWEQAFFGRKKGVLVLLVFHDGAERYGIFNPSSVASEPCAQADLYLERAFEEIDGQLVPEAGSRGVWVPRSELKEVRLFDYDEMVAALETPNEQGQEENRTHSNQGNGRFAIPTSEYPEPTHSQTHTKGGRRQEVVVVN